MLPIFSKGLNQECIDAANNLLSVKFVDKKEEELPTLFRPRNVVILEIEGLDNSGKETLAGNVHYKLYNVVNRDHAKCNLFDKFTYKFVYPKVMSFPDYSSIYGKYIKEILRSEELQQSIPNWRDLYYYDFYYNISDIYDRANDDTNTLFVLVLDRFALSNVVYKCLDLYNEKEFETYLFDLTPRMIPVFNEKGEMVQGEVKEEKPVKPAEDTDEYFNAISGKLSYVNTQAMQPIFEKLHSNMEEIDEVYQKVGGLVDMTVFLSVFNPDAIKEYKKALEEKEGKDLNETFMKQMFLATLYNYLTEPMIFDKLAMQITKSIPMHVIEYKTNWNTSKYDYKIINTLLSIIK